MPGIYGKFPAVLEHLTIPGRRCPERLIQQVSNPDRKINLSLMLGKGAVWWKRGLKELSFEKCGKRVEDLLPDSRLRKEVKGIIAKSEHIHAVHDNYLQGIPSPEEFESLKHHRYKITANRRNISFSAQTVGRMQIGSRDNILETGIQLHRLYGFPYIPGSAIKGLALAALLHEQGIVQGFELGDHIPLNTTRLNKICREQSKLFSQEVLEDIETIFGIPMIKQPERGDASGQVVFPDAWPEEIKGILDTDAWTVHYPKYYKGEKSCPSDTEDPNPLVQLCTGQNTEYRFVLMLGAQAERELGEEEAANILGKAKHYLQFGLQHLSIGAKPDYGFFDNFSDL